MTEARCFHFASVFYFYPGPRLFIFSKILLIMAIYLRDFETHDEFISAYTGGEYVEPWVSYVEETKEVAFNKAQLLNIEIVGLAMKNDVPASGKTVDKNDCEYTVLAIYDDYTEKDITDEATVTGSLVIAASQIEERHSAGTLTLTATYDEFEASKSIIVFQEAFVPTLTAITIDDLTWEVDIPAEGGTATKDNCSYSVTAYYDNGNEVDVTDEAVVIGSLVVEESELVERHSAGTLTLTATYGGFNDSDSVTVWQSAAVSYLTFNITSGGDISWSCVGESAATIEYKKNSGEWTEITASPLDPETMSGGTKINVVAGDKVRFRGDNATYNLEDGKPFRRLISIGAFVGSTAGFTLEGNIMSLIDSVNYKEITEMTNANNGAFAYLFAMCTGLTSAENLILPATTLAKQCYSSMFGGCSSLTTAPVLPATTLTESCYSSMFGGCSSLTTAPELPATTLAGNCYGSMFNSCTSLTIAPELPATTLADWCYSSMFQGCTSLTSAPELPATTLADKCYGSMFNSCTSLTTAPALPATTLANNCYSDMFLSCTSLTTAPALPATTLADGCYQSMFEGCTNLNYIKCLATDISASNCTDYWVDGVSSTGTFVKDPNMSSWTTGESGIPANWTVQDDSNASVVA